MTLPAGEVVEPLSVDLIVNERAAEAFIIDEPLRPPVIYPAGRREQPDRSTDRPSAILGSRGDDPTRALAIRLRREQRDSESASRRRLRPGIPVSRHLSPNRCSSWPVPVSPRYAMRPPPFATAPTCRFTATSAYVFGNSQTGRFLREFLYSGFNVDEHDRRVFDAMWVHIAGAARGSFNERFATPSHGDPFEPTRFPFTDIEQTDTDGTRGSLQSRYQPDQRPKIFYTNTPVEYWGGGRAAALTHTSVDGTTDLPLPDNVRIYMLAGTQHLPFPFPPDRRVVPGPNGRNEGQELPEHDAAARRHACAPPRLARVGGRRRLAAAEPVSASTRSNAGLDSAGELSGVPGVADPRRIVGPARISDGHVTTLPHLVPQVDRDGIDIAGIRDPEVAVPLATTTGWNFRAPRVGNPQDIYQLLGSYIPFAPTRASRNARGRSSSLDRGAIQRRRRLSTAHPFCGDGSDQGALPPGRRLERGARPCARALGLREEST